MFDGKAFGEDIVGIVKGYVEREIAPLRAENLELKGRIAELESRTIPDDVFILQLVQDEIAKIPPAENGKDADPEQVASLVAEEVERAVAALPVPQDGKSVSVEDVAPLIVEEVERAVTALPVPRSVKNVIVNREGEAIYAFSDGTTENIGKVAGKDGSDVDWAAVEAKLRELVDAIPRPKDGHDGFGFEDMDVAVLDDDRTIELSFRRGEEEKAFTLKWPTVIDRGVYKATEEYDAGDGTTWGGSFWIAQRQIAPGEKPDTPDSGWRLAVKKGRDGKDVKHG